jgi:hypothetical protein
MYGGTYLEGGNVKLIWWDKKVNEQKTKDGQKKYGSGSGTMLRIRENYTDHGIRFRLQYTAKKFYNSGG